MVPLPSGVPVAIGGPRSLTPTTRWSNGWGELRIETTPGAGDVVVSIESDSRRSLRLFRKGVGVWRRLPPGEDRSWTLAPGKDGSVEVGVGVMIPEATGAATQAVWPRAFTVEISTKSQGSTRARVPFRVAPFIIPSALEPVDELLIVSHEVTVDSVRSVRGVRGENRARARCSRSRRDGRPVDARHD